MTWYNAHFFGLFGIPGEFLELLGSRFPSFFMVTNLFALLAHFGESLYSWKLCSIQRISPHCTLKWMLQTFIVGYPSLRILLNRNKTFRHRRWQIFMRNEVKNFDSIKVTNWDNMNHPIRITSELVIFFLPHLSIWMMCLEVNEIQKCSYYNALQSKIKEYWNSTLSLLEYEISVLIYPGNWKRPL